MDGIDRYIQPNTLDGLSYFDAPESLFIDGSNQMLADLDMGGHNIKNMADATDPDQAMTFGQYSAGVAGFATVTYVNTQDALRVLKAGDVMGGSLSFANVYKVTALGAPTDSGDATRKVYVDNEVATRVNKSGDTMGGALSFAGTHKITNLANGTASADAINLGQLNSLVFGNLGYFFAPLILYDGLNPSSSSTYTIQGATVQPNTGASQTTALNEDNFHVFAIQLTKDDVLHGVSFFFTPDASPHLIQIGLYDKTGAALFNSNAEQVRTDLVNTPDTGDYTGTRAIRFPFTDNAVTPVNITYTVPDSGIYIVMLGISGSGAGAAVFDTVIQLDPYSSCFGSTSVARYSGRTAYTSGTLTPTNLPTTGYVNDAGVVFFMID